MNSTKFGDLMKSYEAVESSRKLDKSNPIVARIDGRGFSKFTRNLAKPFDEDFTNAMIDTTVHLVKHTEAVIGYTQSDEITLVWYAPEEKSDIWFSGKVLKMTSQLAAQATVAFNHYIAFHLPHKWEDMPTFDARVWNVPGLSGAVDVIRWREDDAIRNSISMAASHHFSHTQLHGKSVDDRVEMLRSIGVEVDSIPGKFSRGTFVKRTKVWKQMTPDEIQRTPPDHPARLNRELAFLRNQYVDFSLPPLRQVKNLKDVIFNGESPKVKET